MKKVLLLIAAIVILSGCGNKKMLTCTTDNTINGITSTTTYRIEYTGNDVKKVMTTYDYNDGHIDGVNTGTDGSTEDNTRGATNGNNTTTNRTDGVIEDNDGADGIVGGAAEEVLDDVVSFTANTILDMAGIRTRHDARFGTYTNTAGFNTAIDTNDDTNYKITYTYDLNRLSDDDINGFGISRDFDTLRSNLTGRGLTCK